MSKVLVSLILMNIISRQCLFLTDRTIMIQVIYLYSSGNTAPAKDKDVTSQ